MAKKKNARLGLFDGEQEQRQTQSPNKSDKDPAGDPNTEPQPSPEMVRSALAGNLKNVTSAAYFYVAVANSLTDKMGTDVFQAYRDQLLHDSGNPSDPIEIMLVEQLALAHFNIGRLQTKSCSVENSKLAIAYAEAATRLFAEFRRSALALEDFRAKQVARQSPRASTEENEEKAPPKRNGKPRPSANGKRSTNGKKTANVAKLTTEGEIPQCLRDRMQSPIPVVLPLPVETGRNGRG